MRNYTKEEVVNYKSYNFDFIVVEEQDHVLTITLDRANKKNALHPQMISEFAFIMHYAHYNNSVWIVVIKSTGDVFCAGMDLKALAGAVIPHNSTVPEASGKVLIAELFSSLHKPIITVVDGDVYAGGFFFLAGSQIVLASEGIKLGLPEVKRGIYPFQVMATLIKVMPKRKVIDWCIRGYNLPVEEAVQFGLISEVMPSDNLQSKLECIIGELKLNSPAAIKLGLEAYQYIQGDQDQQAYLLEMFLKTSQSKDGVEGLAAFREKRQPVWRGE